jgi:hypothetical protein
MAELKEIRRIVIICDTTLERPILETVLRLGTKGYNCVYCFGKGRHESVEDPFTGRSRVRIEVLTNFTVADRIIEYVHGEEFGPYPVTAFMDTVEVNASDTF